MRVVEPWHRPGQPMAVRRFPLHLKLIPSLSLELQLETFAHPLALPVA